MKILLRYPCGSGYLLLLENSRGWYSCILLSMSESARYDEEFLSLALEYCVAPWQWYEEEEFIQHIKGRRVGVLSRHDESYTPGVWEEFSSLILLKLVFEEEEEG